MIAVSCSPNAANTILRQLDMELISLKRQVPWVIGLVFISSCSCNAFVDYKITCEESVTSLMRAFLILFHSYHQKCWTLAVLQFYFFCFSAFVDNVKQDDSLKKGWGEHGMKKTLFIWGEEKTKVIFDFFFFLTLVKTFKWQLRIQPVKWWKSLCLKLWLFSKL